MDSLYDFYHDACSRFAGNILFSNGMTYGQAMELVHARAAFLQKKGLGRGKVVALMSHNSIEMCITFMAIISAGAKVLPLDPNLAGESYPVMMKKTGAAAVFTTTEFRHCFRGHHVFGLEPDKSMAAAGAFQKTAVKRDDIAALFFTSGTTGEPKIVQLTHSNIFETALANAGFFRTRTDDMILCLLPLFHAYGLIAAFMGPMAHGSSICVQPSLRGPDIMMSLAENPVTIFPAVPLLWELIMDGIIDRVKQGSRMKYGIFMFCLRRGHMMRRAGLGFIPAAVFRPVRRAFGSRMRLLISGGAPLKRACAMNYRSMGLNLVEGYGLSETTGPILISPEKANVPGSVGIAAGDNEVKLAGTSYDGTGEILLRGRAVMPGYYKNPAANKQVFDAEGFFRTGDLGRFDRKGNLFVTGRIKNVIVLPSGKNVYPEELENHYRQSGLISEIAVFGRKRDGAESVFAVIVPSEKNESSYSTIAMEINRLNHGLPTYKVISDFALSYDPLPRNSTRKILYNTVRERLDMGLYATVEGTASTPVAELAGQGPMEIMVIDLLKKRFGRKILFARETLAQMGVDSLGLVDLATHIEERLGVSPDMNRLKSIRTLDEFVAYISNAGPGASGSLEQQLFTGEVTQRPYRFFNPVLSLVLDIMHLVFRLFWKYDASGMKDINLAGTIISANHTSYFDIVWLACAIPRSHRGDVYVQGDSDFSFLRFIFPMIPVIWVDEHNTVDVLKKSSDMLRQGKSLIIFPEGGRSMDGRMMEFRTGAAYLARHLDREIIPVAINGLHDIWPKTRRFPRFTGALRGNIFAGEAVNPGDHESAKSMIEEVKSRIRDMTRDINSTGWKS